MRVRATVAHDSYERLVEVSCLPEDHATEAGPAALDPIQDRVESPALFGVDLDKFAEAASGDEAIAEFCRFYLERRDQETRAAGADQRKKKRLEADFTPGLEMTVVAVKGKLHRELDLRVSYSLDGDRVYTDALTVVPHLDSLPGAPAIGACARSGRRAPETCLGRCEISKATVLREMLAESEVSSRLALPEFTLRSSLSGKVILRDESVVCADTREVLARTEAERCAVTGKYVRRGTLEECSVTHDRVLPSELLTCAVTGIRAQKRFFATSSLSGKLVLRHVAVGSESGEFCTPSEARACLWSGWKCHPSDLRVCELTGLPIHSRFAAGEPPHLRPLVELLDSPEGRTGPPREADSASAGSRLRRSVAGKAEEILGRGRCRVEATALSPDGRHLAVACEVRTLFGLRLRHAGLVFSRNEERVVGRVCLGLRTPQGWVPEE